MRALLFALLLTGCSLDIARLYGDGGALDAPRSLDAGIDAESADAPADDAPQDDGGVMRTPLTYLQSYTLSVRPSSIAAAADGRGALVAIGSATSLDTALIAATSTCAFAGSVSNRTDITGPVAVGDLDANGLVDIVGSTADGDLRVLTATGDPASSVTLGGGSLAAIAIGDLDGSETFDVVAFEGGNTIRPLLGSSGALVAGPPLNHDGVFVDGVIAQLDFSEGPELAALQAGVLVVFVNAGGGDFGGVMLNTLGGTATRLAAGDLGGPSLSLVLMSSTHLWISDELGAVVDLGVTGLDQRDVVVAELDGLAPAEIVVSEGEAGLLRVYRWSDSTLTSLGEVATIGTPTELAAVDIDGDEADEILVLTEESELALFSPTCVAP